MCAYMAGMKRLIPTLLLAALAMPGATAAATKSPIRPGCWESTNKVVSPFHSTSTTRRYISAADVDRFLTGPINHHYTCDYPTHAVGDGKLVMKGVCTDNKGRQVKVDSHGTYTPESFRVEATIATRILGLPLSGRAVTEARRIGDACPTPEGADSKS
jgi:hypothetical protein